MAQSENHDDQKRIIKVILFGVENVGKTSLLNRFTFNHFNESYAATMGFDFATKHITLDDCGIKCYLWEMSGHSMRFHPRYYACRHFLRPMAMSSQRDTGIMVVYDKTNMSSLEEMEYYEDLLCESKQKYDTPIMLVGNKCDKLEARYDKEVEERLIRQYMERLSCDVVMETSAKYDQNVEEAFVTITAMCKARLDKIYVPDTAIPNKSVHSRTGIGPFDSCTIQ